MSLMPCPSRPNEAEILNELGQRNRSLSNEYLASARHALQQLIGTPDLLVGRQLERKDGGYARTLLFNDDQMSVYAIVWSPSSQTTIHDHHCSCCFGMLSGSLEEVWFRSVGEGRVVVSERAVRSPGYVACMLPSGPNIHQMINSHGEEAISLHIYGFDHNMHASSILREYRLASL
ncbi:cysteine dioxygenase family protein [Microvirga sp. VF16]|uniref:cysteine dioxygenase family protein n=1 Tax=Microvirga sp. VF16 TaxID=2807101 RepID=UPI001FF050F8|nr:cysteine dioxygenase family protein [Microvirga sp. VF16]